MITKTLFEPFKIKSVEPIRTTTPEDRLRLLENADYNPFLLHADQVLIDLLTDSGTGAMSAAQWAAVMTGDESYAGSKSYFEFRDAVRDIFTFPEVIPTHQGRAAEHLLFSQVCKSGDLVPNNTHFDTTRANLEYLKVEACDIPIEEGIDPISHHPFKGNMDPKALDALLKKEHHRIPFVMLTITNNSVGGQPVSLENVAAIKELVEPYGIPLYIDCARFAENAYFIKIREPGQDHKTPIEIARELFSYADGALMSCKKDGLGNIGGFLAVRDPELASNLRDTLTLTEGFPTYGGLAGRDMAALALGLYETLNEDYLAYRIRTVAYMAERLLERGVPIVEPPGGHAIFIDAGRLLSHLGPESYPGQSLVCALYLEGGIRAVEVGSVMLGSSDEAGNHTHAPQELVRLAFPRRVYTQSHFDYAVEIIASTASKAAELPAMEITYQPKFLRHFTSHFKPSHPFPSEKRSSLTHA